MNMTPEERLNRMEAILERLLRYEDRAHVHHMGLRSLFRTGVRRMDDLLDRQAQTDSLLSALMSSQLRTEESLQRTEESLRESQIKTDESLRAMQASMRESQMKTDESLRDMQASIRESHLRTEEFLRESRLRTDESLRDSQIKTDASVRAMQESVNRLTETFQSYLESRKPKDDHPLQT
jgi:hypothetical protein